MKILILLLAVLVGHISRAAETLEEERKAFSGQLETISANAKEQKEKLGLQMITALGKSREAAKKAGNLDLVKAIDGETERWVSEGDLPLVPSQVPEINKLHDVFIKTIADQKLKEQRATLTAYDGYEKKLGQLEKTLVAQDKIKEAEAVRSERETTGESMAIKDAREAVAKADAGKTDKKPVSGPVSPEAAWKRLLKIKRYTKDGSQWFIDGLKSNKDPVKIDGEEFRAFDYLATHASGRLNYSFDEPISEFRSKVCLVDRSQKGNIIYKVETEEGVVFTSKEIKPGNRKEDVNLKFKPTKKLSLIIDENGTDQEDWGLWVNPEYR